MGPPGHWSARSLPKSTHALPLLTLEPLYLPRMWKPGDPVTSETLLEPLLVAIGFGLQDVASYQTIAEKLKTRSVSTVGDHSVRQRCELAA